MPAELDQFVALFNNPSVEAMHKLLPKDFERFVACVLRRAGYDVKEVGPHWIGGVAVYNFCATGQLGDNLYIWAVSPPAQI